MQRSSHLSIWQACRVSTTGINFSQPKWLIALLAAVAAMAVATALTLIARRGPLFRSRERARQARSREQMAMAQDVRAVPDTFRVDAVKIRDTGREPTHTVRLEPHPGITTTTIKEGRP